MSLAMFAAPFDDNTELNTNNSDNLINQKRRTHSKTYKKYPKENFDTNKVNSVLQKIHSNLDNDDDDDKEAFNMFNPPPPAESAGVNKTKPLPQKEQMMNMSSNNDLISKFSTTNVGSSLSAPITLTEVLKKTNVPKLIDLFSLDVEGYEFEVLEGIDFENYKFKYFLIETNNFDKLNSYLIAKKYKFIDKLSNHDYLFTINE